MNRRIAKKVLKCSISVRRHRLSTVDQALRLAGMRRPKKLPFLFKFHLHDYFPVIEPRGYVLTSC